jgi:hypothetical protein
VTQILGPINVLSPVPRDKCFLLALGLSRSDIITSEGTVTSFQTLFNFSFTSVPDHEAILESLGVKDSLPCVAVTLLTPSVLLFE